MVPELVPRLMNEMGLLSLEIERMPKRLGEWMADPAAAPYLSVVSPSTHDTTTLRMWWDRGSRHHRAFLVGSPWARKDRRQPSSMPQRQKSMIRRQMASPAMLCILPMSDLFAMDDAMRRTKPTPSESTIRPTATTSGATGSTCRSTISPRPTSSTNASARSSPPRGAERPPARSVTHAEGAAPQHPAAGRSA